MLKARILTGNPAIKHTFLQLKREILSVSRDKDILQNEVIAMRARIEQHQESLPLKHIPGGLLDLEFLVQFLVLNSGGPELARSTQTLGQLKRLHAANIISKEQFSILKKHIAIIIMYYICNCYVLELRLMRTFPIRLQLFISSVCLI